MSKPLLLLSVLVFGASVSNAEPRRYAVVRSGTVESQWGYLEGVEASSRGLSSSPPDPDVAGTDALWDGTCARPVDPPLRASKEGSIEHSVPGPMLKMRRSDDASESVTAAPQDLAIFRISSPQAAIGTATSCNTGAGATFTGATIFTCEPTVASDGDVLLMTGNRFAAISDDGGLNWRYVDPYDSFNDDGACDAPANSGMFCCDQVALHDSSRDQMFWYLQYSRDGNGNNAQRLAVARTMSDLLANVWTFYDFDAATFGFNGAFWLDFPDLTLSDDFLWITTRIFDNAPRPASQGEVLLRISLDDLKDAGGIGFQFVTFPPGSPLRCVRGAGDTAFCGQQRLLDEMRIHRWFEDSNEVAFDDVGHPGLAGGTFVCTGPGGRDFCQGGGPPDNRVLGAYRSNGELGFMRMSAQNPNFAYPYVDVLKTRESDRGYLTTEPMWSNQFAVMYPSVHPNSGAAKGGVVDIGGGTEHPNPHVFIVDGYNDNSFSGAEVVQAGAGTATPPLSASNRWGDYLSTQLHWLDDRTYVSSGFYLNGPNPSNVVPVSVWFGRVEDQPPGDFDLRSAFAVPASSYLHGEPLDVGASVANVGVRPVSVPILEFRLSVDQDVNIGDTLIGATAVNLDGGAIAEAHVVDTVPELRSGDYFIGAVPLLYADAFNGNHDAVSTQPIRICPNVAEHPLTIDVPACATANFRASSTGPDLMDFRWQNGLFSFQDIFDDGRITGAGSDWLRISRVVPADGQVTYRASIFNNICNVATFPAGLNVIPPTASPITGGGAYTVCQDVTLDATSNGVPDFTYQWRRNSINLADDDHRIGSQQEDLSFDGLLYSDNGQYTVRIDNPCDGSESQVVPLSVAYKPWTNVASTGPSGRNSHSMAYDSRRGVTVLFGGTPGDSTRSRETWEWDGNVWTLRSTGGPTGRTGAAMAYDSDRGVCVLFGGSDSHKTYAQDTWEWDGAAWTQHLIVDPPLQRIPGGMAYDSSAHRMVMHGGWVGFPFYRYLHDTWEYEGTAGTWTQVSDGIPELPPGNYNNFPAFAYDSVRNKRYVFNAYVVPGDFGPWGLHTFEWDGAQWVRIFPTNDPQYINPGNYRGGAGIAYHEGRQMVIWNNGAYAFRDPVEVTWGFDGSAWHLLSLSGGPPRSASAQIAYDSARNAIVQFGGGGPWGMSPPDTWELVDADRVEILREPQNRAVISGQPVEFSVLAKGAPNLTYQWRRNGNNLSNGAVISGATTSRLRIGTATFAHPGAYDVVITNDCGSVTSPVANLTVIATLFGDGDVDGDVDLDDASLLPGCQTAPGDFRQVGCEPFDFDGDGDVDLADLAAFQLAFAG